MKQAFLTKVAGTQAVIERVAEKFSPAVCLSSLGAEDMVLTDIILARKLGIDIVVLDTGRLHADTLALVDTIRSRYGYDVRIERPDPLALQEYVALHGADALYRTQELRRRCCEIRKVQPLARALAGKRAWITGMRREQTTTRGEVAVEEFDAAHGLAKFNPLADWTEVDVWGYLRSRSVPYNRLYDQGYRSIGCAPCTRPVLPTEDSRAGRWWWESDERRECGLHLAHDGTPRRAKETTAL